MTTATQTSSVILTEKSGVSRLTSIDIFRGLTMVVMIFVNDLASVRDLPWWTYHVKTNMGRHDLRRHGLPLLPLPRRLVDPPRHHQRLKKNPSLPSLCLHTVIRAASLIVLGLILANAESGDRDLMHIDPNAWATAHP